MNTLSRRSLLIGIPTVLAACAERRSIPAVVRDISAIPVAEIFEFLGASTLATLSATSVGDVAHDRNCTAYAIDRTTNRVRQYTLCDSDVVSAEPIGDGTLSRPFKVGLSESGDVFVIERGPYRVSRFDKHGSLVSTFLYVTHGIIGTAIAELTSGNLLLSAFDPRDGAVPLLYEFTSGGEFTRSFFHRNPIVSERRFTHFGSLLLSPGREHGTVLAVEPCSPTVHKIGDNTATVVIEEQPPYFIEPPIYPADLDAMGDQRLAWDRTWLQSLRTLQFPSGHYLQTFIDSSAQTYFLELYRLDGRHLLGPIRSRYRPLAITDAGTIVFVDSVTGPDLQLRFARPYANVMEV